MKVGSLVYATDSGLGILAKSFVDAGVVTHPMVIRHGRHITHDEWYPGAPQVADIRATQQLYDFVKSVDVMLFFETPFNWELIPYCRAAKVKTVLMVMHECLHNAVWTHQPDLFLCPSMLDYDVVRKRAPNADCAFLTVPVEMSWRQRTKAEVFVHNAGHGGLKGRNGTAELLAAWRLVKSPAQLIVTTQAPLGIPNDFPYRNFEIGTGTRPHKGMFHEGDVFLFPERFNGLSLPLQEARAAGMLVMCGDRFPMNTWLPKEPLIPVVCYRRNRIGPPYQEFHEALIEPRDIAAKIDEFYGKDISAYSLSGREWAEQNSWEKLKPKYMYMLEQLCKS